MNERPGAPGAHSADDDYSATALASHWIQRPDSPDTLPLPDSPDTLLLGGNTATEVLSGPAAQDTPPDRVEGTLLRFGPGVNADTVRRVTQAPPPVVVPVRRRTWRRHALPTVVLLAVLAFLLWHRPEPSIGVDGVAVSTASSSPGCDETADVVAVVTTNGRPGTLTYRWVRSDGTFSKILHEDLTRGQKQARLHLLWTFQGKGTYGARAELRLLSPERRTVSTRIAYHCR
ncbi:hypothetical protein OHB05_36895 [Streptomyces sp. NBC_00638]|uniref:hypothetical protein n=1 Tax=unclassified Streptomyces TaxID=2593676 RepID=UPI00224F83DD|nr:hypothetical protein [Streptomyces sp. NBC_00638]MCX5008153.1 hypothetical protein [Streptomyces sp. NBC_00638]